MADRASVSLLSAAAVAALLAAAPVGAAETLHVVLDKTNLLRLGEAAATVLVGSPEIAEVTVESPKLLVLVGRKTGETNLTVLNRKGDPIASFNLLVVPEGDRHVTVHRGAGGVATFSCDPRCVGVKNPGLEGADEKGKAGDDKPKSAGEAIDQLGAPKPQKAGNGKPPGGNGAKGAGESKGGTSSY